MVQITKDDAYQAVAPDDFPSMLEPDRYGHRCTSFDRIISATHDHFWDPLNSKYIDFSEPFDIDGQQILPDEMFPIFLTRLGEQLKGRDHIRFANQSARWSLSSILHGEQGALALSASLCHILSDPGAQEYAANQTREEARHVTAFSAYIKARFGTPLPCGPTLENLLTELVLAPEVYKKIVGMQMLVEGLAMGAFATLYQKSSDPLLVKLCQLVNLFDRKEPYADLFRPNTRAVYLESPGSLTFEVQDFPAIASAARRRGIAVIHDNTWATGVFFRSFEHGASR